MNGKIAYLYETGVHSGKRWFLAIPLGLQAVILNNVSNDLVLDWWHFPAVLATSSAQMISNPRMSWRSEFGWLFKRVIMPDVSGMTWIYSSLWKFIVPRTPADKVESQKAFVHGWIAFRSNFCNFCAEFLLEFLLKAGLQRSAPWLLGPGEVERWVRASHHQPSSITINPQS